MNGGCIFIQRSDLGLLRIKPSTTGEPPEILHKPEVLKGYQASLAFVEGRLFARRVDGATNNKLGNEVNVIEFNTQTLEEIMENDTDSNEDSENSHSENDENDNDNDEDDNGNEEDEEEREDEDNNEYDDEGDSDNSESESNEDDENDE
jgi:single-stranded DNA-binding protein